MNCQSVKLLLSDFADEALDAATAWQVQTHLSGCAGCTRISRDLASVKQLVQALPTQAPSAGFDAALAQRLALTRRPAAPSRRTSLARIFSTQFASPTQRRRPALALGLVIAAGTFAAFFSGQPPEQNMASAARSADHAFVADCVAQHHRDAAAEPLADLSAQTLAGSLDGSAAPDPAADANPSSDSNLF